MNASTRRLINTERGPDCVPQDGDSVDLIEGDWAREMDGHTEAYSDSSRVAIRGQLGSDERPRVSDNRKKEAYNGSFALSRNTGNLLTRRPAGWPCFQCPARYEIRAEF